MITRREPSTTFLRRCAHPDCFALPERELRDAVLLECPESLEALALQCCASNPDSRPTADDCVEWLQSLLDELGGFDEEKGFGCSSSPCAVVAPSPVREGTVIYPKTREAVRYSYESQAASTESGHMSSASSAITADVGARLSYLEIQVQELRAENKHLSREIMRLSELNKKDSSLHSSCESFEHDTPQTPSSERGPSPPRRQSRGRAKGSAQTQHLGDVLTDIDVLKKSLLQLSADVSQTRPREPDIGICKGVSSSDESGKQLDHRIAESANSSSPIVGNGRPVISDVTTPGTYSGRFYDGVAGSEEDTLASSSMDAAVQSFLDVVGKCSEVLAKSHKTLNLIDTRSRRSAECDTAFVDSGMDSSVRSTSFISSFSQQRRHRSSVEPDTSTPSGRRMGRGASVLSKPVCSPTRHDTPKEPHGYKECHSGCETPPTARDTWRNVPSRSPAPTKSTAVAYMSATRANYDEDSSTRSAMKEEERANAAKSFIEADCIYDSIFRNDSRRGVTSSSTSTSPIISNGAVPLRSQLFRSRDESSVRESQRSSLLPPSRWTIGQDFWCIVRAPCQNSNCIALRLSLL